MRICKWTSLTTILLFLCFGYYNAAAQKLKNPGFKVLAFYTAKNDKAHISFVHEANRWFLQMGEKYNFSYDSTSNWAKLNADTLANYQAIIFLDTRPEETNQRVAFKKYMENGGGWMGFHFSAFALTPSAYNQDWDWYHNEFLGSGQYVSNTWRPTSAYLKVENTRHPVTKGLLKVIKASPNEWYRWEHDLRNNPNISILLSIDAVSFPLGTGPKQSEIWHSGYYPVVWSNRNYKMVYFNMGHNDIDYEGKKNKELSHTFDSPEESKLILNALIWIGKGKKVE